MSHIEPYYFVIKSEKRELKIREIFHVSRRLSRIAQQVTVTLCL